MIVLHGVAELAETISEYTLSIDNKTYSVTNGPTDLHDNIVYEELNGIAKTDGTSAGSGSTIRSEIVGSNIETITISGGYAKGSRYTLIPEGDSPMDKETYLDEAAAFVRTGRVDFSLDSVGYNSPTDGAVFTTWMTDNPVDGFGLETNEENIPNVKISKDSENKFFLEYETKTVVEPQANCDWYVATSLELTLSIVTKTGAIAKEQKLSYKLADAPIASYVTIEGGKFLTFDNDIAVVGGWWESLNIPARTRQIAKSGLSTRDSMFRYLIFGSISPKVFSPSVRNMIFTAKREGSLYTMDKVLTNNLYEAPDLSGLSISSSGPGISGSASIIPNAELGTISIDTSEVSTDLGEMFIEISDPLSINSCKFQIKAGFAPTANFLVAAADSRVVYNQITGTGTTGITGTNIDNGLIGFHLFVNGLQEYLINDAWDPLDAVLGLMTMGISCALTSNMTEFVFFLYYESTKSILWSTERTIVMREITGTQEHYLASMAYAQQGVDAETRKKIARQWLEMLDSRYMKMSGPTVNRTFFMKVGCVSIPMDMPDSIPYTLGLPMYGVPMGDGIIDALNTPDQLMTDDVYSMMKKNAQFSMYRTRMDWAMALGGRLGEYATYWAWGGTHVAISIGGQHQELYAASDEAYSINSAEHRSSSGPVISDVAVSGEIGEAWNEIVEAISPVSRFTYWNQQLLESGVSAETAISEWRNPAIPVMYGMVNSVVINIDDNTVTINGHDTRDAIIYRPNPNVILAFEKPQ